MGSERSETSKKRRKRSPKQCASELAIAKRQESACALRLAGWSIRDIAGHLKCAPSTVHEDIAAVLERTRDTAGDAVEKQRRLSLARIDRAVKAIWPQVEAGNPEAIRELIKLEQRRAKVEGFDAADKHEVTVPGGIGVAVSVDARAALDVKLDDLRKRLAGESGGNSGTQPGAQD